MGYKAMGLIALSIFLFILIVINMTKILERFFKNLTQRYEKLITATVIFSSLLLTVFIVYSVNYLFCGGSEQKYLARQYSELVKMSSERIEQILEHGLPEPSDSTPIKDAKGILVLHNIDNQLNLYVNQMPKVLAEYRAEFHTPPRFVIVITLRKKHVSTTYGAGAGKNYEYRYTFDLVDYTNGTIKKTLSSSWEYESLTFPEKTYEEILEYTYALL